jgi:hypothetical protein
MRPAVGSAARSAQVPGCHSRERSSAREHCRNTVSMLITSTLRAALPSIAKRAHSAGSTLITARPFTRSVSLTGGTMNSSATRGSASTLRRLSTRLLPRRSGSIRVRSSSMCTKPAGSPRGDTSSPPGPLVASAQNGAASMTAR